MASFRKSDNGTWQYRIRYKDKLRNEFKEKSKSGFKTKKEAQLAALEMERELNHSNGSISSNLTFREVFTEWWDKHSRTIKQSTRYTKLSKFNKQIIPYFGNAYIKDITQSMCQNFIDKLADEVASMNDFKIQASLVFKYAEKQEYIKYNPMRNVIIPKKPEDFLAENKKEKFWNKDELKLFLNIAENEMTKNNFMIFYLLSMFGIRKGELFALEWNDIDFSNQNMNINKTLFFEKGKEVIQKTKTYETRDLFIADEQLKVLKRWKIQQREELLKIGVSIESKYLVCRPDLRPHRLAHPNDLLESFFKKHGDLNKITVHGFRHTFASLAFEAGLSLKEVQILLGHKDIQTTMNIYVHVSKQVQEKGANKINKFLGGF